MTRSTLSSANRGEIQKNEARQVDFAEFNFPGGVIRVCNADRDFTWGPGTWSGNGTLLAPAPVEETADMNARRVAFKLSGLDAALIARIMNDNYLFATVKAYVGYCDSSWVLVGTPHALGDALLMSNAVISLEAKSGVVELSSETWALFSDRDSAVLATPQSQKLRFPGDTGQDRMAYILTQQIEWGGLTQLVGVATGGAPTGFPGPGHTRPKTTN